MIFIPQWADEILGKPKKPLFSAEEIAQVRSITQISTKQPENQVELQPILQKREVITLKGRKNGKRSC